MAIHDSSPRDREKIKHKEQDFYQTPKKAVEILLYHLKNNNWKPENKVLDPCCGERVISNVIGSYFKNVGFFDLYPKEYHIPKIDFLKCMRLKYDLIVMNPPYSKKKEFIDHALTIADDIFVFLPLQVMNYIDFTEGYLDSEQYIGQIIIYPKMILNETQNIKQGGITAYAWFHFSKFGRGSKYQVYYDIRKFK